MYFHSQVHQALDSIDSVLAVPKLAAEFSSRKLSHASRCINRGLSRCDIDRVPGGLMPLSWHAVLLAWTFGTAYCFEVAYYSTTARYCCNDCTSGNTTRITSVAECESAARALNWSIHTQPRTNDQEGSLYPPGCRINPVSVFFINAWNPVATVVDSSSDF